MLLGRSTLVRLPGLGTRFEARFADCRLNRLCRKERPAGLVITTFVHLAYTVALRYEGCVTSLLRQTTLIVLTGSAQAFHVDDICESGQKTGVDFAYVESL